MGNKSAQVRFDLLNRRALLGKGAALMGGAAAGLAVQSGSASAQDKPATAPSVAQGAAKSAAPEVSPNLHPPVLQAKGGKLRGFRDGKIYTFLGIPYAEADRFELPRPVQPWDGIKNAQAWGPVCPIPDMNAPSVDEFVFPHRYWLQNEHCQVLNVWTPGIGGQAKKPVMFWIHGGSFVNGSSMEAYAYDGRNLSEYGDVVVVSLNHRLNVIGTLDLSAYGPQYENTRYTGTADLVAALQWVHDNIEAFGGDPGNVTIFGQSGGGAKTIRTLHTPAAKGLFHKAIAQSGGGNVAFRGTDPAKSVEIAQAVAAATLKNLGLDGSQIDKLKKAPYRELLAANDQAIRAVAKERGIGRMNWEDLVISDDRYIQREFCDWTDAIPLMAGSAFSEGSGTLQRGEFRKNEWSQQEIEQHLTEKFHEKKDEVIAEFKKALPRKKIQDAIYFNGDERRRQKALLARKLEIGKKQVFNYLFAYEYTVNGGITSFHCSEIVFAFHNVGQPQSRVATGGAPAAFALQDKVARAWTNFAKTGNPNQPGASDWKAFTPKEPYTMVFDAVSECRLINDDRLLELCAQPLPGQPAGKVVSGPDARLLQLRTAAK